jgi:hypothetical protein
MCVGTWASSSGYDFALSRGHWVQTLRHEMAAGLARPDPGGMQLVAKLVERSGWRRWWQVAAPVLLLSGAWVLVAGVHLLGVWIANLGLLAWLVYGLVWLIAITVTAFAVRALWRLRGPSWAVPMLVLSLLAPLVVVTLDWTSLYVHGYYRLNRADFAAVAALARSGEFGADSYYGDRLPPELQHLSINGKAARIHSLGTRPDAVFLPAWTGIPDGAVGYAYLVDPQDGTTFDCFADPCRVRWSLGDGWYWLDRS